MPAPTFGLKASQQGTSMSDARQVWTIADQGGLDGLWVYDHLAALGRDRTVDAFEAWTLMAAMAQATTRTRIGCLVFDNTRRHPGLVAKMAVTVDHVSGGRLDMGLGAGGDELVDGMLGMTTDRPGRRIDRLAEACEVLKRLWSDPVPDYAGEHYSLIGAIANPKPVQRPHPPLWIAGTGEKRSLPLVARHADVWISGLFGADIDEMARLSGVLDRDCAAIGRDPGAIRRASQVSFTAGDEDGTLRVIESNVRAGFTEIVLLQRSGWPSPVAAAEAAVELLPRLRSIG
jgi:alkanesulfonate monooxygenase SsuD/methylene tetrahydromethanopterin reductase-like flavin-dependent oxidoreductase (luciferase family)